jgi:molybdate transport system substrate-binding protein
MTATRTAMASGLVLLIAHGNLANAQRGGAQPRVAEAKPSDVRVIATAAIRAPLEAVRAAAEQAIGHPLVIEYGSARGNLNDKILAGQAFDVAILVPDVNEELAKQGKVAGGSFDIARGDPSIGQRGDVPPVDVSTPAALRVALLKAKFLWWSDTGTSSPTVNRVFDTLGIRDAVKPKYDASGAAPLAPGEYELHIRALSEILENNALRVLGPVPSELRIPTVLAAVISAKTGDVASARALITFLQGPGMDAALKASGMRR